MQVVDSKFQIFINKQLQKVSFNIRNLKRSTIKEYYTKEENKRKSLNKYDKNNNTTLASIESEFLLIIICKNLIL